MGVCQTAPACLASRVFACMAGRSESPPSKPFYMRRWGQAILQHLTCPPMTCAIRRWQAG